MPSEEFTILFDKPGGIITNGWVRRISEDAIELAGPGLYCDDVWALAAQMLWMKGVTCDVEAK